mmetsp:Transcript_14503/g.29276  ORF Transcript_14503/g.29276 Transcript_14503/m.29276 type:complete len:210 (-) Transcript_14503:1538-2167(-)
MPAGREVLAENVEHAHHLRENQDAVPCLLESLQEFVQEDHLARRRDHLVHHGGLVALAVSSLCLDDLIGLVLSRRQQEGVVAHLLELHDGIHEALLAVALVERLVVLGHDVLVESPLHGGLLHAEDTLGLLRERLEHLLFDPSQEVGLEGVVQFTDGLPLVDLVVLEFEVFVLSECVRIEEVQEAPQFLEGVLQRSPGDEEAVRGLERV